MCRYLLKELIIMHKNLLNKMLIIKVLQFNAMWLGEAAIITITMWLLHGPKVALAVCAASLFWVYQINSWTRFIFKTIVDKLDDIL